MMRRSLVLVPLLLACAVAAEPPDRAGLVDRGREVFTARGCPSCHTMGAAGTPIAEDLSHVGRKYDQAYLRRWLRNPAAQKPKAHMPKLDVPPADVDALAAYLASLR